MTKTPTRDSCVANSSNRGEISEDLVATADGYRGRIRVGFAEYKRPTRLKCSCRADDGYI